VGEGTRTPDIQIHSLKIGEPNALHGNTSGETPPSVAVQLPTVADTDPDLTRLSSAWPKLPDHIRAAILALVTTAR
jgi:hypothetical protein